MIKRLYSSIHIALIENFEQMTIRFNQYCLLTKYWSKDTTFQTTESSKKVLNKKNSWTHIVFLENFDQETIWFNPYSILRNFWRKWFSLVQFGSIHIVFLKKFDQKSIKINPYYPYWKLWANDNMVQLILFSCKILIKR